MPSKKPKSVNPLDVIGEVLGRKAEIGFDPSALEFLCPFVGATCTKRGKNVDGPYPVCSIWRGRGAEKNPVDDLIIVCPKRFHEIDFVKDVVDRCWPGDAPKNPRVAPEVTMKGFGKVDFVVADVGEDEEIKSFLSIELQAIDITGSVFNFYSAIVDGNSSANNHASGFNWDNVYKRYVTQLVRKGFFHHHWNSKIIAVIPEQVFDYIRGRASFMVSEDVKSKDSNIVFVTYRLKQTETGYRPILTRCVGTHHSALQSAMMYAEAPEKSEFADRISDALNREIIFEDLSDEANAGQQELDV